MPRPPLRANELINQVDNSVFHGAVNGTWDAEFWHLILTFRNAWVG